jgi:NAD(P)-dependent dehydrogenase (short-subunit alcohol dehydrogenase family)
MSKIILITGASMGIGLSVAEHFTQLGHRVYGTSRKPMTEDVSFTLLTMDVMSEESVQMAVNQIIEKEGRIDIVINNAGLGIVAALEEVPESKIQQVFETNVWGTLRVCKAVLPQMRKQGSGLIINVSSVAGTMGLPFRGIYSASKAAVEVLTESLSMEVQPFGIKVCSILPSEVKTNINANRLTEISNQNSPYQTVIETMNEKVNAAIDSAADPMYIVRAIEKIVNSPSPKLHYVEGPALQKMSIWLKRLLPDRMFEGILKKHYGLK